MSIKLGDVVPDFTADTTHGTIKWHEKLDGKWTVLFSHPADFTPVCTTELGTVAAYQEEFDSRGVQLFALSCDTVDSHKGWIADIESAKWSKGNTVTYPIIADPNREIANLYRMIDPDEKDAKGIPLTARAVFIVGPDKKLKLSLLYPATTGRNFDELIRVIDSLQLTAQKQLATPVNWTTGKKCMVIPTLTDDQATEKFGSFERVAVPSGKGYIRMAKDPDAKFKLSKNVVLHTVGTAAGVVAAFLIGRSSK